MVDTVPQKRVLPPRERRDATSKRRVTSPATQPSAKTATPKASATRPQTPAKSTARASGSSRSQKKRAAEAPQIPQLPKSPVIEYELPTKVSEHEPLPTLPEKQPEDLSISEYQSIAESAVLAASLHQSRSRWLIDEMFTKYWSKPSKRKGISEASQPDVKSMQKLGACTMVIEPHRFEVMMYTVKDPNQPPPPQYRAPVYPPPAAGYTGHPGYGVGPSGLPLQARPPFTPQTPVQQVKTEPGRASFTPTPMRGGAQYNPPNRSFGTPSTPARPQPSPAPESEKNPVIQKLAAAAASDPELKALMKVVASSQATPEQLRIFQGHIDKLNAIIAKERAEAEERVRSGLPANQPATPAPAARTGTAPTPSRVYGGTPAFTAGPSYLGAQGSAANRQNTPSVPISQSITGQTPAAATPILVDSGNNHPTSSSKLTSNQISTPAPTASPSPIPPQPTPAAAEATGATPASAPSPAQILAPPNSNAPPTPVGPSSIKPEPGASTSLTMGSNTANPATASPAPQTPAQPSSAFARPTPPPPTSSQSGPPPPPPPPHQHPPRPSPQQTQPSTTYGTPSNRPSPFSTPAQPSGPYYASYPPPPPPQPLIKHIVFENLSPYSIVGQASANPGAGDRYLFPAHAVLDFSPSTDGKEILVSFFVVRKGSQILSPYQNQDKGKESKKGKDKEKEKEKDKENNDPSLTNTSTSTQIDPSSAIANGTPKHLTPLSFLQTHYAPTSPVKEYYQPVTLRLQAPTPKTLETIARAAKPLKIVQEQMESIIKTKERARTIIGMKTGEKSRGEEERGGSWLALRLPRDEGVCVPLSSTTITGTDGQTTDTNDGQLADDNNDGGDIKMENTNTTQEQSTPTPSKTTTTTTTTTIPKTTQPETETETEIEIEPTKSAVAHEEELELRYDDTLQDSYGGD